MTAGGGLLAAVRAERLARRVEAVRAAAADSKTVVKVILQDEAGRVLVLTDSRTGWDDLPGGHVQQGEDPVAGLVREVYEETGIRLVASDVQLYREQAIPKPHGGRMLLYKARTDAAKVKISEEHSGAAWVKRDQLGQRNLGRYAKDVEAALKPDSSDFHAAARDKARSEHKNAALRALGLASHAVADGQTAEPGGKAKVVGGMLSFLALGAAAAYLAAHRALAEGEGVAPVGQEPEAEAHAESRTPLVKGAVEDAVAELEAEKAAVEKEQVARGTVVEGELSKRLAKKARELEGARWERLADAEATATYGAAALRVLDLAGFATVRWSQLERPTKRHTHKLNQDQGEQPLGFVFSNGQAYPGDPARGPEENINCLCQLVGVRRKEEKVGASEWDESKHKRGQPENAGEFGPGGGGLKVPLNPSAVQKIKDRLNERVPGLFKTSDAKAFQIEDGLKQPERVGMAEKMTVRAVANHLNSDQTTNKVKIFKLGELNEFERGGKKWQAAGYWHNDTKTAETTSDPSVMAHELGHAEFDYAKERALYALQDAAMRHQLENGAGAALWKRGSDSVGFMRADGTIHTPKTSGERIYNAILEFKFAHRETSSLPTEYAKSWASENIWDAMPAKVVYKENDSSYESNLATELATQRTLHEAYAEYSSGNVLKKLSKEGLVEPHEIRETQQFAKMDGPEGRKAYLKLKAAIDEHADKRRKNINE